MLIVCVDCFNGFPEPIETIYPQTEVQQCIAHHTRNTLKDLASKNQKAFMADLGPVYRVAAKSAAETALNELDARWDKRYPLVIAPGARSGKTSPATSSTQKMSSKPSTPLVTSRRCTISSVN